MPPSMLSFSSDSDNASLQNGTYNTLQNTGAKC